MTKFVPYDKTFFKKVIDIKEDKITENPRRYSIEIELNRSNNSEADENIVIIMMNPSKANRELSDDTVNRIIKEIHIQRKKVKIITILNLFVVFEKDSKKLKDYISEPGYEFTAGVNDGDLYNNNDIIEQSCKNANEIIIAWGDGEQKWYRRRENEVLSLLKRTDVNILCCNSLSKLGYPRHPQRLPGKINFISYSIALTEWVNEILEERAEFYYKKE
jgi:hypothetical protein